LVAAETVARLQPGSVIAAEQCALSETGISDAGYSSPLTYRSEARRPKAEALGLVEPAVFELASA